MNKNEIYEIEITGITDDGNGVGKADGMAVFVPYALLGEKLHSKRMVVFLSGYFGFPLLF